MNINGNKILITGGGSGIGLGLASRFTDEGNKVVICGRRLEILQQAKEKNNDLIIHQCDLSSPDERIELYNWIKSEHSDLNVLINNAGIQNWINISDDNFFEKANDEITINIEAPLHLISLFLKLGSLNTIINVTSGLAYAPLLKVPVYSATKSFMNSFSLSMKYILKQNNIEVIEIIPPALNTDLGGKGLHDFAPPVSGFIDSVFQQLKDGKTELTYGFTDNIIRAGREDILNGFKRMNGIEE